MALALSRTVRIKNELSWFYVGSNFSYRLVDVGTEWRSFSNESSGTDPSRVGAPENPLLGGSDLSTSIAVGFGGSESDQR